MSKRSNLSDYIYSELAQSIAEHGQAPCDLTLTAIADNFGVSVSPVRAAVERLASDRFLKILDNGRLAIGRRRNLPKQSIAGKVLPPDDRENEIKADLIRRSLLGEEGFVREKWASAEYEIGRTALRPILSRLAGEGLIEQIPRRGWRIRRFDKSDLRAFLEVRELLELRALELARPHLERDQLEELLDLNRSASGRKDYSLNNTLHQYWISNCENGYIQGFFAREAVFYRTLFDFAAPEAAVIEEMAAQHCRILEAIIARNWKKASKELANHIRSQEPIVTTLIETLGEKKGKGIA